MPHCGNMNSEIRFGKTKETISCPKWHEAGWHYGAVREPEAVGDAAGSGLRSRNSTKPRIKGERRTGSYEYSAQRYRPSLWF